MIGNAVVHQELVVGLVRNALQLDARGIRADERDPFLECQPPDGLVRDERPVVRAGSPVEPGAVEVEKEHVALADLSAQLLQLGFLDRVSRCLMPEVQQDRVPHEPVEGEGRRVHARAAVVVGELDVGAAVRRHADVLKNVPGVRASLVLRVQLVGEVRVQRQVVLLLPREEGMAQVHQAAREGSRHRGCSSRVWNSLPFRMARIVTLLHAPVKRACRWASRGRLVASQASRHADDPLGHSLFRMDTST